MKEETRDWFEKAEKDFGTAANNFEIGEVEASMFFLHQSVEKALKAFQIENRGEYSFSHDLVELANEEIREDFLDILRDLNPVYTGFRYPDVDAKVENPEKLQERVEELFRWIRKQLKM